MKKAFKYRIYPSGSQRELINKTFGCVRFVYNQMLSDKIEHYELAKEYLNVTPAKYKKEYPWLKEVDSLALANAQMHLNTAFRNFFRFESVGYPNYKSKKNSKKSYTTSLVNNNIRFEDNKLVLPKLGPIKVKKHRELPNGAVIKSVTVSMTAAGKYYASVLLDIDLIIDTVVPKTFIGLDFSMKELFVSSEGESAEYPKYYRISEERLKKAQRKLSKCEKGSNNYYKQKLRVAKIHEKIRNRRNDFMHKLSKQIVNDFDAVCVESLSLKGLSKALKFGKSVHDNSYGLFLRLLEYKLNELGKHLIKVDKWYPSSKTCSNCGNVKKELSLSERIYYCEECGIIIDRDYNASINIKNEGMRLYFA